MGYYTRGISNYIFHGVTFAVRCVITVFFFLNLDINYAFKSRDSVTLFLLVRV